MSISSLRMTDFRNLATVDLEPCSTGLNIIYGNNGSGKTSLLEAIHYIGMGRSFRTGSSGRLVRHQADKFTLFAQLCAEAGRLVPVGMEKGCFGSAKLRVNDDDSASITDIASFLPIRVINTHSHHLFESGPIYRRKYLDWGLFYHSDAFLSCWRHFERALKQRNAALRDKRAKREVDSWTEELVKHGLEFHAQRVAYVRDLAPYLAQTVEDLLGIQQISVNYLPGWDESEDYAQALNSDLPSEYRAGHTQHGPHRADLDIEIQGISAKYFLSRGQQKLLVCAMIVAQGMLLAAHGNKRVVYLVDDLPAELDKQGRDKLMTMLSKQDTQVFITAIEKETICDFIDAELNVPAKLFHVEHGKLS